MTIYMEFELKRNEVKIIKTQQQIYDMMLPGMFTTMLMRMSVGESYYHYDTGTDYKRIK